MASGVLNLRLFSCLRSWHHDSATRKWSSSFRKMLTLQPTVGLNSFDGLGFDVSGVDIIEHVVTRRVNFFSPYIQHRSELQVATVRLSSGVHSLSLLRWTCTFLYCQDLSNTVGFLWLEQLVFTEGQVLVGEFCLSYRWYTDTQTWTLPLLVTSLMCIMTLWQFLFYRALYVVNYVGSHNCLWCVCIFLQLYGRIIVCCRLELYTWRYY
jgi:hypothetical protein